MNTTDSTLSPTSPITGYWDQPALISLNDFKFKALSNFAFNTTVGCAHACRFCYVASTSTNKQKPALALHGVKDPDAEWGNYVLVRKWDLKKFRASLTHANELPVTSLTPGGNRAVILSSTTDAYQVIPNADPKIAKALNKQHREIVRTGLEMIRDESDLNVRILTRGPLARQDFDLFKSFGKRLLFGMSIPTLNNQLARVFEPNAPAPSLRLATLKAAKEAGLYTFAALAPTYPACDEADLRATLGALAELEPYSVFHEPINIRAENVERIRVHAESIEVTLNMEAFATKESWAEYALSQLQMVERVATDLGLGDAIHLWPDKELSSTRVMSLVPDATAHAAWLTKWWTKFSRWPA